MNSDKTSHGAFCLLRGNSDRDTLCILEVYIVSFSDDGNI